MKGFDFGQIGEVVSKVMDTDYIDIKRNIEGSLVEMYSNISCHIAYMSVDNPDPLSVDVKPIVQGMTIHFPLWVDIRNDDFIIAKKIASEASLAGLYRGSCGTPVVSPGRKKAMVQMLGTVPDEPTPVPPENPIEITISYMSSTSNVAIESSQGIGTILGQNDFTTMVYVYESSPVGEKIYEDVVNEVEKGSNFATTPLSIEGYLYSHYILDGVREEGEVCTIENVQTTHTIVFVYDESEEVTSYAFLVNGLYTRNDGTLANGWHSYKSLPIKSMSKHGNQYTIGVEDIKLEHEDNGKILTIKAGQPIVIFPSQTTLMIGNVTRNDGIATFNAMEFVPDYDYYRTRWYDR